MSIETLKQDLAEVIKAAPRSNPGFTPGIDDVLSFLNNNILPWLESATEELAGVDEVVDDLVHQTPDVLHSENAELFGGIIVTGRALVAELRQRIGNDQRVGKLIKEWTALADEGMSVIEEIVIPDDEDGDDEENEEPETVAVPSTAVDGGAA
jgi:hypothetical protein